jgi:hypothetical protein
MIDTVDTTERPLDDRGARSLPFGGGCAVAFGLVLIGFGVVFALAVGLVAVFGDIPRDQRWLIPPALLFVVILGGGLLRIGLRDWSRAARGKEMAAQHPDQPWFADWAWDPKGTDAESAWGGAGLMVMMFIVLVMAPFNVLWFHALDPHEDQTTRLLCLMVLIPDFFIYLLLKAIVSMVRDRIRFGQPHLAFDAFPFFLGESLDARVTAKAFAGQEGVVATLRCIDERMSVRRYRARRSQQYVRPFQLYEARQTFPGTFAGEEIALTFPLPAQPATNLLRQPALYWELEIRGGTTADVVRFTVPIYARIQRSIPV